MLVEFSRLVRVEGKYKLLSINSKRTSLLRDKQEDRELIELLISYNRLI